MLVWQLDLSCNTIFKGGYNTLSIRSFFPIHLLMLVFAALIALKPVYAQEPGKDTWARAEANKSLRWGADQEGGAPYIFPSEQNAEVMVGFEVDMAEKLTETLQIKVEFQQGQWDALLTMLDADKVDFVMNGYEWMPERVEAMETSIPYYVYALQLMVNKNGPISTWDVMKSPTKEGEKWKVGVLSGSAAEEYMTEFGGEVEVISYDGVTDAIREVETGKLDATLQDTPIASFYVKDFPELKFMGDPVAPGYYVIYSRRGDVVLNSKINAAIITMFKNGDLQKIYERYGMWNKEQEELKAIIESGRFYGFMKEVDAEVKVEAEAAATEKKEEAPEPVRSTGEKLTEFFGILVQGAGFTILLSAVSFPIAIMLGLLIAVGRLYGPAVVRIPLTAYVEFLRGTPLMLQLYFIFYFLPDVGINIPAIPTAIMGLAINYSAYESEIYRAGLQAIPVGQMEAALSLGMSRVQAIRRIIVPQAVRIVIPPVVNDFIALFKDTSVCSVVTIVELTKSFSILSRNNVQLLLQLMIMTGLLYMLMSYPMSVIAGRLEKKLAREAA
jgi:polar amino acid transport system substrate-binding protein